MKKILIADDDEDILKILEHCMKKLNYASTSVTDGKMAVEMANQEVFDLILLDIHMPIMDGLKALERIRRGSASMNTPVIVVTGDSDRKMVEASIKLGAADYILKPFNAGMLLDKVCRWVNSREEGKWKNLRPEQEKILRITVTTLDNAFDAVREGKELPYDQFKNISNDILKVTENGGIDEVLNSLKDHDSYTFVHSLRVGIYLSMFAKAYGGFGKEELMVVTSGGVIHDVGKAMTPLKILNKPAGFEPDEWLEMKEHVNHTVEILRRTPDIPEPIIEIGWCHHEKLDGTGYPRGLKGDEIGTLARMAAIVDAYVALTDRRVYKPGFPVKKALEMLKNPPGHLDQDLVKDFTEMILS